LVSFAIKEGLTTHQPFAIRAEFISTKSYEGEYDCWVDSVVVAKEAVKQKIIAQRYGRWIKEFGGYTAMVYEPLTSKSPRKPLDNQ
jgi:hypothetical protein